MTIFERAREIILHPRETWQVVKEEQTEIKQLFLDYAAPLALIPAVCALISITIIGIRMPDAGVVRAPFFRALTAGTVGYLLQLAGLWLTGKAVKQMAAFFGSQPDLKQATKLVIYAMTPVWLLGVFQLIPGFGILSILGLYGIYLLALGLPPLLGTPDNKVVFYLTAILAVGFVITMVSSVILVGFFYGPMFMRMMAM